MKRIYLIGYMGSGKSTLGKVIAKRIGWNPVDMDSYIENRYHKTVNQIFASEGEDGFRRKEKVVLEELSSFEEIVISCGGGTPCFFNNMELMNNTGITVYIQLPPKILADRLRKSRENRPLVKDKSDAELEDYISAQMAQREGFYKKASVIFNEFSETGELNINIEHTADVLLNLIKPQIL